MARKQKTATATASTPAATMTPPQHVAGTTASGVYRGRVWTHDSAGSWLCGVRDEAGNLCGDDGIAWVCGYYPAGANLRMTGTLEQGVSLWIFNAKTATIAKD